MSCNSTVDDLEQGCVDGVESTFGECAHADFQRCTERAAEDIKGCDEEREVRERVCDDWELCDVPIVCDFVEGVGRLVCKGWSWAVHIVCVAPTLIKAGACIAWETVSVTFCSVAAWAGTSACKFAGWTAETFLCPFVDFFGIRILESRDEPRAESVVRLHADSMSIAHVATERGYRDSGIRYFFRLRDGIAEVSTLTKDWVPIAPDKTPQMISYRDDRTPVPQKCPRFDMICANSGRVMVKEIHHARFYVTMLEPMFLDTGARPIPSLYFKLDPEQGQPDAVNEDRTVHLRSAPHDSQHPAAVRIPLFEKTLQIDQNDSMIVNIDNHLKVWHRIDGRPPKDGGPPPKGPGFPPTDTVVVYGSSATRFLPIELLGHTPKAGYRLQKVLDIGVGHENWHEQRSSVYGGEIDSLDGPGLPPCLEGRDAYRLFNGPVEDQGGFIDGTVNYYILGQFRKGEWKDTDDIPRDAFGILWLDEQAVLSERWRLLDPADFEFGLFKDLVPSAVVQYLFKDFRHFHFDRSKFFCPLRAGYVTPRSRMAVSRQTVILSGRDPKSGDWELYSINASFGTWDRTWRWRELPIEKVNGITPCPQEFGLREDMTIYLREGCARVWFQRYLPASLQTPPDPDDLLLPGVPPGTQQQNPARNLDLQKPARPIGMPWQWLPADVFDFTHRRLTHFGCYQSVVDWRWQYYRISIEEGAEIVRSLPESTCWEDVEQGLSIRQECIDWERVNRILQGNADVDVSPELIQKLLVLAASVPGAICGAISSSVQDILFGTVVEAANSNIGQQLLCQMYAQIRDNGNLIRTVHRKSLFNSKFLLKLLWRDPLGYIMVHCDKRDDDLLPFVLRSKDGDPVEVVLQPRFADDPALRVRVRLHGHKEVRDFPRVEKAEAIVAGDSIRVRILPALPVTALDENVWRISIGFVGRDAQGQCASLEVPFTRIRRTAERTSIGADDWHEHEWSLTEEEKAALEACCDADHARQSGTTLWFEDVVGHVGTADQTWFRVGAGRIAP